MKFISNISTIFPDYMLIINKHKILNTEYNGCYINYNLNEHFPKKILDSESQIVDTLDQKMDTANASLDTSSANVDTSSINMDTYVGKVESSIF